jgi:hypothetical protein
MVTSCALPPHVWQGAKVGSVVRMARSSSGRHVQSRPQLTRAHTHPAGDASAIPLPRLLAGPNHPVAH